MKNVLVLCLTLTLIACGPSQEANPVNLECEIGERTFTFSLQTEKNVSDVTWENADGKKQSFVSVPTSFTPTSVTIKLVTNPVPQIKAITMRENFIINRKSLVVERQATFIDSTLDLERSNTSLGRCEVTKLDTSDNAF